MFVRDFIYIDRPFAEVAPRFVRDRAWLQLVASRAGAEAAALSDSLRATSSRDGLAAGELAIETGTARARADSLVVPIRFLEVDDGRMPVLEADLEVTPMGPNRSVLTLNAQYQRSEDPDAVVVGRLAEAGMRAFLHELVAVLDEGVTVQA